MSDDLTPEQREIERIAAHRDANSYLPPERLAAHLMNEVFVLRDRIEELERERDTLIANVNLKADFIEKTVDQLAGAEARADALTALLREAEGVAVLLSAHIPDWISAMSDWDLGGEAAIDDLREMEEAVSALLARLQEPRT